MFPGGGEDVSNSIAVSQSIRKLEEELGEASL